MIGLDFILLMILKRNFIWDPMQAIRQSIHGFHLGKVYVVRLQKKETLLLYKMSRNRAIIFLVVLM